jgi:mono/diheme cytochrome c family protein
MKRVLIGTIAAVALVAFAGAAAAQDAKIAKGKQLFTDQKCTMCHSIAGTGNAKGPLDDVGSKLSADEIRGWITDPAGSAAKAKAERKPPMSTMAAKYKALSKDDVDALVAYLSSLKKK